MKKILNLKYRLIVYIFCALSLLVACKKSLDALSGIDYTNQPNAFSINDAKAFYEANMKDPTVNSLRVMTITHIGQKAPMGNVMWNYGYSARNNRFDFVEVPIVYANDRAGSMQVSSKKINKKILSSNLNRLIIYRNKNGVINERILSYVPDSAYAAKHWKDVGRNKINKLDPEYSGYIMYHDINGTLLFFLTIKNGVPVKKTNAKSKFSFINKFNTLSANAPSPIRTNDEGDDDGDGSGACYEYFIWQRTCQLDAEGYPIEDSCTEWELVGSEWRGNCFPDDEQPQDPQDPDPGQGPPEGCYDPANFDTAECATGTTGGGGTAYPYSDGQTVYEADGNIYNDPSNNAQEISDYQTGNEDNNTYNDYQDNGPWPPTGPVIPVSMFQPYIKHVNCLIIAKMQIEKMGYTMSAYGAAGQTIQIYKESNGVDASATKTGIGYMLSKLSNNIPVVVGVDVAPGADPSNLDHSTDHFIVIVGSGSDSNGHYFTFYDGGTSNVSKGTDPNNKLYYNPTTGKISGHSAAPYANAAPWEHDYIITQIRKSKVKQ